MGAKPYIWRAIGPSVAGVVETLTVAALAMLVAAALAAAVVGSLRAGRLTRRAFLARPTTGREALVGREAVVRRTGNGKAGQVLLEGAWWTVRGRDTAVTEGQRVRVVDQEGLDLVVIDATATAPPTGTGTGTEEDSP
ncbi:NfeD family protein [Streptomyces specialis]|uniref:NfeD family protein n=1 Tax=Streptomyces specialis TaxID=498367 RepID=UPI00073E94ED|nr:NfeD family protein [Streptomyces specialis]